jgi:hypothetical protein
VQQRLLSEKFKQRYEVKFSEFCFKGKNVLCSPFFALDFITYLLLYSKYIKIIPLGEEKEKIYYF